MQQHNIILAQVAIEKSDTALKSSYNNLDSDLTTAQNRAYYTVFYLASALSYLDDFVSKSHHYIMGQFNKRYIHEQKIFNESIFRIYKVLIANREKSDYSYTYKLTRERVSGDIEAAKTFIDAVKPYVLQRIAEAEKK